MSKRDEWDSYADGWTLSLMAGGRAKPSTIKIYGQALDNLAEWARANGVGDPLDLDTTALRRYFLHFRERKHKQTGKPLSAAYVRRDYTSLVQFFKWLTEEEERDGYVDPMRKIHSPKVEPKQLDVLTPAELRALLLAARGSEFADRRDAAMIRLLFDAGLRRGEIMGMSVEDVDLTTRTIAVGGPRAKTGPRRVGIGLKTAEALSRYLRARSRHRDAKLGGLWLSAAPHSGVMGIDGLRLMLARRGREANVEHVHPHRFRHTAYDLFQEAGGEDTTAMSRFGWSSRSMLDHYARSSAEGRAIKVAHRLSPSDRI